MLPYPHPVLTRSPRPAVHWVPSFPPCLVGKGRCNCGAVYSHHAYFGGSEQKDTALAEMAREPKPEANVHSLPDRCLAAIMGHLPPTERWVAANIASKRLPSRCSHKCLDANQEAGTALAGRPPVLITHTLGRLTSKPGFPLTCCLCFQ